MQQQVYLYCGEEEFLIEEKLNELKKGIDNPALNVEILEGREINPGILSLSLQTAPMFGGEKLVIVNDPAIDADNQNEYISAFNRILPGIKAVFRCGSVDKRSKFYKLISEIGEVVEFKSYAPWETDALTKWIEQQAEKQGKRIQTAAARLLEEICGSRLRVLAGEIEKLITYIGENKEITEEDVRNLSSPGEISAFALLDALREKEAGKVLSLFQVLLKNREDLFQLLSLVTTQYRLMLQVKSVIARTGKDPWKIAKAVGGNPYFVKKCAEKIDRFTLDELKNDLELLLEAGLKMKTGETPSVVFELLLVALCGK
jgi:DNA polymerase-3 subunit delta